MNSPARRNPKKPVQAAAQSITVSELPVDAIHMFLSFLSMSSVIGRRGFGFTPACACSLLTPVSTYSNRGMSLLKGLSNPW